jgi:hypothetical protein
MFDEKVIEQRLATLERAVADLQRCLAGSQAASNWLETITRSISDEAAFREALELGRTYRQADRPPDDAGKQA